ncbi:MAG: hypothetical protein ACPL4N_02515 [Candidatus Norongarragalinales archaeon]
MICFAYFIDGVYAINLCQVIGMAKLVRVSDGVFEGLHEVAANLQIQLKQRVSLGEAVQFLLESHHGRGQLSLMQKECAASSDPIKTFSLKHGKFI